MAGPTRIIRAGGRDVPISHPDKVLFPDIGLTKYDLARYYVDVADVMLPHVAGRPVMMQRLPEGIEGYAWYHKDVPDYFPDWIERVPVPRLMGGTIHQLVITGADTLAYLADQACVTPHVWLSRADDLTHPDRLIFDLDTGSGFRPVRKAARLLRVKLGGLGLRPFAMTTGSRGLHVVCPLDRSADFDEARAVAVRIAHELAEEYPRHFTTEARKAKRLDRLFIDVARNSYAATAVSAYAVRARPGAPVATPIGWDELGAAQAQRWNVGSVRRRLAQKADPWREIGREATALTK